MRDWNPALLGFIRRRVVGFQGLRAGLRWKRFLPALTKYEVVISELLGIENQYCCLTCTARVDALDT